MAENGEGALDLLPAEWEVLSLVDGTRDVRTLAKLLARSEFDIAKTIFGLESAGVLHILQRPSGETTARHAGKDAAVVVREAEEALERHDLTSAGGLVETALATFPQEPRLHLVAGRVHLAADRNTEAEECFRRALRLDSLLAPAHRFMGHALARQGRFGEAVSWWQRWVTLQQQTGASGETVGAAEEAIRAAAVLDQFLKE